MSAVRHQPAIAGVSAAAEANARTAAQIATALVAAGVTDIVASPGGRNIPLLEAFHQRPELRVTSVVDERQAGFVALGIACGSARVVATVATSGSASAHYLPAVVEADANAVPLMLISADRPESLHRFGAPQCMPQTQVFAPYVRASLSLEAPDASTDLTWVDAAVSDLLDRSSAGHGPVHLNVPLRDPLWAAGAAALNANPEPRRSRVRREGERVLPPTEACRIAGKLLAAKRGVIVCGPRVGPRTAQVDGIVALAQRLQWPLLAECASDAWFRSDRTEDVLVSRLEALASTPALRDAWVPDFVLQFGREPVSRAAWEWLAALPSETERMVVSGQGRWFDPHLRATEQLVASPDALWAALDGALTGPSARELQWLPNWLGADRVAHESLADGASDALTEASVSRAVAASLGEGDAFLIGNSMPVRDVGLFSEPTAEPVAVFANRGVNGIDGHIAMATGLAAGTGRRCVALIGDLTALHDLGALALVAQCQASVTLVVVDNGGGGIFEHLPVAKTADREWFERRVATAHRVDIGAVGKALGLTVFEATTRAALERALEEAGGRGPNETPAGPSLIIARVDRSASKEHRRDALAAANRAVAALVDAEVKHG